MSLNELFDHAILAIKDIHNIKKLDNDKLLIIYGLYKQSTNGDIDLECDFKTLKEKRLWESWNNYKGYTEQYSKNKFIEYTNELLDNIHN